MYATYDKLGGETKKDESVIIDSAKIESIILSTPVVCIDFYADWCGPCKAIAPEFARISQYFNNNFPGGCGVFKCDYQKMSEEQHDKFRVGGLPTFVFFVYGREVDRIIGADINKVEEKLRQLVSQHLNSQNSVRDLTNTIGPVYSKNSIRNLKPNNHAM